MVWKYTPCSPREMPGSGLAGAERAAAVGAVLPDSGVAGTLEASGQKVPVVVWRQGRRSDPTGGRHWKESVQVGWLRSRCWLKIDHWSPRAIWSMPERSGLSKLGSKRVVACGVPGPSVQPSARAARALSAETPLTGRSLRASVSTRGRPKVSARSWKSPTSALTRRVCVLRV